MTNIRPIQVDRLLLDPENPRLPEQLQGSSQDQIFEYLYRHGVLDELVDSMLDNGFFGHEPLIVLPADEDGRHVVVEGNRRLAALHLIHDGEATGDFFPTREPTPEEQQRLLEVNCYVVESRESVNDFLGFRHISGLRPWKPEAKARYVTSQVEAAAEIGEEHPFLTVARQVGSNVQGVRNAYVALALLRHARDHCGADVSHVLSDRFGVWTRCLNSPEIRTYFGYDHASTLEGIQQAFENVNCDRLSEVLGDLAPRGGRRRAILSDSRRVTQYGLVLKNEMARDVLREYEDLEIAVQVIAQASLPDRVAQLTSRIDALRDEVQEGSVKADADLVAAAQQLQRSAKFLAGAIEALAPEES